MTIVFVNRGHGGESSHGKSQHPAECVIARKPAYFGTLKLASSRVKHTRPYHEGDILDSCG